MIIPLTEKQERFCQEYLLDLNAKRAAVRAGYSEKTAYSIGHENLKKPEVSSRISELKKKRTERTEITVDYVLSGLKEVAERCLQKSPVMKWDYVSKQMVQVQDEEGRFVWSFDSQGANRAFELLGKHVGVFEKDNGQKKPEAAPFTDVQVEKIIAELRKI